MRELSSTSGSFSYGETSWEAGDSSDSSERSKYQDLINKANAVPILKVFQLYNLKIDDINRKITCPFKSHKGGRESTASFYYYPHTNTYWCYGCKQGSHPVDFVMNMEGSTRVKSAKKILERLNSEVDQDLFLDKSDFNETLQIMLKFSNLVREFRINFNDEKSFKFIEENCKLYDNITSKHNLNNEALRLVVDKLSENINKYSL
jgi:DNA primase